MSLAIFLKNNIVIQTVHTVGLTEMWLIYAMSLLKREWAKRANPCAHDNFFRCERDMFRRQTFEIWQPL